MLQNTIQISPKASFRLRSRLKTLKFGSVEISAVNPGGLLVPLRIFSRLHPNRWFCNLQIHTAGVYEGLVSSAISSWGWHQTQIFIALCRAFPCTLPPHVLVHPSIGGTAEWPHRHPLCGEFARLWIRFSGICSVNDILGLCLTGGHIVRVCIRVQPGLVEPRLLAVSPWSSWLIHQIFILSP